MVRKTTKKSKRKNSQYEIDQEIAKSHQSQIKLKKWHEISIATSIRATYKPVKTSSRMVWKYEDVKKIPFKSPSQKILIHMLSLYWSCFMLTVSLSLSLSLFLLSQDTPSLLSQNPLTTYSLSHSLSNLLSTWDSLPKYSSELCLFFLYSSYPSKKQPSTFSKMATSQPKMLPYFLCFFHCSTHFHNLKSYSLKLSNFSCCPSFLSPFSLSQLLQTVFATYLLPVLPLRKSFCTTL